MAPRPRTPPSETPEVLVMSEDEEPAILPSSIAAVETHLERLERELHEAKKAIKAVAERHESEMNRAAAIHKLKDDENEALRRQLEIYKK
jgi:hypothetical protein